MDSRIEVLCFTWPEKEKYFYYIYDVIVKQKKNALLITTVVEEEESLVLPADNMRIAPLGCVCLLLQYPLQSCSWVDVALALVRAAVRGDYLCVCVLALPTSSSHHVSLSAWRKEDKVLKLNPIS